MESREWTGSCTSASADSLLSRSPSNKTNESLHPLIIEEFDARAVRSIVRDLAEHYGVATAFLALESPDGLKLKARLGVGLQSVGHGSIAKHGISRDLPIIVEDIQAHSRFAQDPLVTGPPRLDFFAGSPLMIAPGRCVGSLCIMDTACRTFLLQDAAFLDQCAKAVCDIYKPAVDARDYWKLSVNTMVSLGSCEEDEEGYHGPTWTLGSLPENAVVEPSDSPAICDGAELERVGRIA